MSPPPANSDEHACDCKRYATDLAELLAEKQAALDALTAERDALVAAQFGGKRKSEKAPKPPSNRPKADPAETARKRRKAAEQRAQAELEEVVVQTELDPADRVCSACGGIADREMPPEESVEYDYVPAKMIRRRMVRQKLACRCGECVLTAPAPAKLYDRAQYGAGLAAHVLVGKCVDAIPLYRMAKIIARTGVPVSDRSLGELLTRCADLLAPLYLRLEELIRQEPMVMADETPIRIMAKDKTRRGYIWTFRTAEVVLYRASAGRSGETPQQVLGATTGTLLTDGYSGYNQVTTPQGRQRAGCWAHARRNFVEAMSTEPELAGEMIALIAELYGIESRMRKCDKLGSDEHQQPRPGGRRRHPPRRPRPRVPVARDTHRARQLASDASRLLRRRLAAPWRKYPSSL